MSWSVVPFGRYRGKTLPEIIMLDLDWFFGYFQSFTAGSGQRPVTWRERPAPSKFQKGNRLKLEVEYRFDVDNRFCGFAFVKAESWHSRWTMRLSHLDLAWPLRGKKYNKQASRILIRDFRLSYFGKHKRLTKQRCEEFFSNDKNFLCR
jgi:hypothetical protein